MESVAKGQLKAPKGFALNDGTVQVLRAQSRETAEHWLSAWCRANPTNRLVLCEQGGDSLDATLMATGAAACGFDSPSSLRPALQTLALALDGTVWFTESGGPYDFFLVPARVFEGLCQAASKGKYFNQHIRDRYSSKARQG